MLIPVSCAIISVSPAMIELPVSSAITIPVSSANNTRIGLLVCYYYYMEAPVVGIIRTGQTLAVLSLCAGAAMTRALTPHYSRRWAGAPHYYSRGSRLKVVYFSLGVVNKH